jgi:hypothetical protein
MFLTCGSAGRLEESRWTGQVYSVGTFHHGWILVCTLCTQVSSKVSLDGISLFFLKFVEIV